MVLSLPSFLRRLRLRAAATDSARAKLMDDIARAHAAWVQANEQVIALGEQGATADDRLSAENARAQASDHYKLLVDRLMQPPDPLNH